VRHFSEDKRPKSVFRAFSFGSNRFVGRAPGHPSARPPNGLVPKMGPFLWQELDEVDDVGRLSVKKRSRFFQLLSLLDERASSARFSDVMVRRLRPRRKRHAVARFHGHLAFPARDRRISRRAALSRETSLQRVVHGDQSCACSFESVRSIRLL